VLSTSVSKPRQFWYAVRVKSSVSIVLFFLLSGFFLATLLGSIERNRRLLAVAGALLAVLVCIIVFVRPVQLPSLSSLRDGTANAVFVPTSTTAAEGANEVSTSTTMADSTDRQSPQPTRR